ncbi:unnamed protein product [Ceutorhynchus assimilis]|uniref:Pentatricopeptide repeat-containing protein 2 n=1 Tax=Ceutorhynchus assimilis TaxID=467358 RepID=A0A9N9QJX1_9CUCU|nr:unnamed protein product [Ceutorhynchus assimilis]
MTNTLFSVLRKPLVLNILTKNIGQASIYAQDIRNLYSMSALGLDGFEHQQQRLKLQISSIGDKFKEKMSESVSVESKNMIFTEDLKNMIHIAETDQDVGLVVAMLKKYNKQNKSLRFGNYIFGPVVLRMLYLHNKSDLAIECFRSEELSGLFDQYVSFQILLDLLYENGTFKELLEMFEIIVEKQLEGHKYPKNVVVLAMAACYKLNNQESLNYALNLWSRLNESGHQPMRRATTFCACLAVNQGKPDIALEILCSARNQNYTTVRNIRVAALADIGRLEDVLPILKNVVSADLQQGQQVHTFNRDVIERIEKAVSKSDNPELTLEFNRLKQIFEKQGHINNTTLNEQLCLEIQKPPTNTGEPYARVDFRQNYQSRGQQNYNNNHFQQPRRQRGRRFQQKPGLEELV